jgi:DDE superfamily endonuclease
MQQTRQQLREAVKNKLGELIFTQLLHFLQAKDLRLWGEDRPKGFKQTCIYIALYVDLFGKSIRKMRKMIKAWWGHRRRTLRHNQQVIRKALNKWGKKKVVVGTQQEWNRAVMDWDKPVDTKDTNLWIDSVDLPQVGKTTEDKKGDRWSFKLNGPGQRYLFLFDGKGRIQQWWGGYTPKLYDGHALQVQKNWLRNHLQGGVVVADKHFAWGNQLHKDIRFLVKVRRHRMPGRKGATRLGRTPKEKRYNQSVQQTRARVERWFAAMKNEVRQLKKPWFGKNHEQDWLVSFAVGLLNARQG